MPDTGKADTTQRTIVLVAAQDLLEQLTRDLSDGGLLVRAFASAQQAVAALPKAQPHALVVQQGQAQPRQLIMARQLAELAASRKVPVVLFGVPDDESLDQLKAKIGILETLGSEFTPEQLLEAVRGAILKVDQWLKQAQKARIIRQNLARAAEKLNQPRPDQPEDDDPNRVPNW